MRKMIGIVLLLILCCATAYSDIDYSWSLLDIGLENIDLKKEIHWRWNFLNLSWVETNTGLGLGTSWFSYIGRSVLLFPVEFMWNPFSTRLGQTGIYGTLGIYDKVEWEREKINGDIVTSFVNTVGIRYMISTIPYGRTREKGKSNYRVNSYIFAEYSKYANYKTWRVGLSVDVGFLASLILLPIFYATEKPIDESKL
jgi:hypothetical protein